MSSLFQKVKYKIFGEDPPQTSDDELSHSDFLPSVISPAISRKDLNQNLVTQPITTSQNSKSSREHEAAILLETPGDSPGRILTESGHQLDPSLKHKTLREIWTANGNLANGILKRSSLKSISGRNNAGSDETNNAESILQSPRPADKRTSQIRNALGGISHRASHERLVGNSPSGMNQGASNNTIDGIHPHLIQASSTPLQNNEDNASDSLENTESDLENNTQINEYAPLLHHPENGYQDLEDWAGLDDGEYFRNRRGYCGCLYDYFFRKNPWSTFFLLFLIVLLVVIIVCAAGHIDTLLNEAILPDIQSVSVLEITESGMSVHVVGSVYVEYERITNYMYLHVLKMAGLFIGGVSVVPRHGCKVYVSGLGISRAHALDIFPPELFVDLIDRRLTEFDFLSEAVLIEADIAELATQLLQHNRLKPLELDITVVTDLTILSKWFHYNTHPMAISNHIVVEPSDMSIPLQINDMDVKVGKSSVALDIAASTLKILPLKFSLNSIEWDVAIPDCKQKATILGEWITEAIDLEPDKNTNLSVHGNVTQIPDSLLEICENGLSPFNSFTNKLMEENTLSVLVRARASKENQQNLPKWLYSVLSSTLYAVDAPVPAGLDYSVTNMTVDSVSLMIPSGSLGIFCMGANVSMDLKVPFKASDLEVSISDVVGTLAILDTTKQIVDVSLHGDYANFSYPDYNLSGVLSVNTQNVTVEVLEPVTVGKILNEIVNKMLFDMSLWDFNLDLAFIRLPIVSTTLRHLRVQHRKKPLRSSSKSLFDRILSMLDIRIDQVLYVDSTATYLDVVVDLTMSNPFNWLLSIPDDTLTFDYLYNNTNIGTVWIDNVLLPPNVEDHKQSVSMRIVCETTKQRIFAEEFVSRIISAAPGTTFDVRGNQNASRNNPALAEILAQVEVDSLNFPKVLFGNGPATTNLEELKELEEPQDPGQPQDSEQPQSPFLLDATFHLLTSEIELTVFNPIANAEIMAEIFKCQASYKGETLANIDRSEVMMIPPGIYKTPRIPIKIALGLGSDILRKAMNGDLYVDVTADLAVRVDEFSMQLLYHGSGLTAQVKL